MDNEWIKHINLQKTIKEFGYPKLSTSQVYISCICGKESLQQVKHIKRKIKTHGNHRCASCRLSEVQSNPEYRKKSSERLRKIWEDNQCLKELQSKKSKELWQNPEYKKRRTKSLNAIVQTDEYRENQKEGCLNNWKKDEFAEKIKASSKQNWKNPEYRKKQKEIRNTREYKERERQNAILVWQREEYREKAIRTSKRLWQNPNYYNNSEEYKNEVSERSKKNWNSIEFREKQAKARASFLSSGKDSIIERVTQQILDQLNTPFERQKIIGPYSFDLFVPSNNLLVECQGEYWHSLDKAKSNDSSKFTYIDKYFPDYKILYLYERDFLNPGIVKQKLIRELFDPQFAKSTIDFLFSDLEIKFLSVKEKLPNSYYSAPEEFLQSFHYAGFGRSPKLIFGAYLNDNLIAVCKFASVIRKEVATSLSLKTSEVLELDRFCIHPSYQKKNFASWFISKCVKLIDDPKIKCLVSFADSTFGHSGTIYKAANWTEIGKVKPSYHYINQEGWVIHKKTLWNHAKKMSKSESAYAEEHGYQKVQGKEKIKFIFALD